MNQIYVKSMSLDGLEKRLIAVFLATCIAGAFCFPATGVLALVLILTLVSASFFDCTTHRIPNTLTYSAFIGGIAVLLFLPFSQRLDTAFMVSSVYEGLFGACICFAVSFAVWCFGGFGGGDVKLSTIIGLLLGAENGMAVFLAAQVLAAVFILIKKVFDQAFVLGGTSNESKGIPMAGFYSLSCVLLSILWSQS